MAWYFPDSSGGTEVYIENLVRSLNDCGVNGSVIAASSRGGYETYRHNAVQVYRYPVAREHGRDVIRGTVPHEGFETFKRVLDHIEPDIFHLHSWTPDSGLHHLRYANSIGLPCVLTMHTATLICMRGTMMRDGVRVCDGFIETKKCTECVAQARGAPMPIARALSRVPGSVSRFSLQYINLKSAGTAVAMRSHVELHEERFREAVDLADRIVVLSEWQRRSLQLNGVRDNKVVLTRHGVSEEFEAAVRKEAPDHRPIRVGMIGRADSTKGMHTALIGFKKLKTETSLRLHIHAMAPDKVNRDYLKMLMDLANGDDRIRFSRQIEREELPEKLKSFDLLAVPSECMETGPLVVLEALASKVPVFGSRLGGIKEYVQDEVNGRLIEPGDPLAWGNAFDSLSEAPDRLACYRYNIQKMRTMAKVASETHGIYKELCS